MYKQADDPILKNPKPYDAGQGWIRNGDGVLESVRTWGSVLPNSLVDLPDTDDREEEEDEEEDEFVLDNFNESHC